MGDSLFEYVVGALMAVGGFVMSGFVYWMRKLDDRLFHLQSVAMPRDEANKLVDNVIERFDKRFDRVEKKIDILLTKGMDK